MYQRAQERSLRLLSCDRETIRFGNIMASAKKRMMEFLRWVGPAATSVEDETL